MTSLKYNDKHNQVAFLKKPTESTGFHEIVDFLKATPLRYTLTHNPTIYDSLVKQFWQTAIVKTLANGIQELVASIDNNEYVITEASVRSKLQLTDAIGIHNLPDAKIYDGLATLGGFAGNHVPLLPAMIEVAAQDQGEGSEIPSDPHHTPVDPVSSTSFPPPIPPITEPPHSSPSRSIHRQDFEIPQSPCPTLTFVADEATTTSVGVGTEGATTTTPSLDAGLDSGNIYESPLRSYDAPLSEGNTSGSVEDSLKLKELSELAPKLVMKIDSLEKELKETKQTFGHAVIKLGEEPENQRRKIQDIDDDPMASLAKASMNESVADFITPSKVSASEEAQEKDISPTTMEAARTLSQVASDGVSTYKRRRRSSDTDSDVNTDLYFFSTTKERIKTTGLNTGSSPVKSGGAEISTDKGQREGKAQMTEEDIEATEKKRLQLEQERAGLEEVARLQTQMDAEVAKHIHMDKMVAKRMQEEEEAKLEASAELTKILQGENVSEYDFAKKMVDMINQKKKYYAEQKAKAKRDKPMTQAQQRDYMRTFIKNQSTSLYSQGWTMVQLNKLTFKELKQEFKKLMRSIERIVPMRSEERIKRPGIELEKEPLKKQKIVRNEEVPAIQENVEEPVIVKEEEIA
ncbi:hypothetical protein Tco_0439444 [Tanacetum coccineum]